MYKGVVKEKEERKSVENWYFQAPSESERYAYNFISTLCRWEVIFTEICTDLMDRREKGPLSQQCSKFGQSERKLSKSHWIIITRRLNNPEKTAEINISILKFSWERDAKTTIYELFTKENLTLCSIGVVARQRLRWALKWNIFLRFFHDVECLIEI